MKKVRFIYNPYSGEKLIKKKLDIIFREYQNKGYLVETCRISSKTKFKNTLAGVSLRDHHHILIAGGDGTINQVVNLMKKTLNFNIPIAILPTGTANDFAKHINIPLDISKACKQILNSEIKYTDLGHINDHYFINVASMGILTDVSQKTDTKLKNTLGKMAYYVTGLMEIVEFKPLNVVVKSKECNYKGKANLILIFNGFTAGNIKIAYKSKINDGKLDVIISKSEDLGETFLSIIQLFQQRHLDNNNSIIHFQTNKLNIDIEEKIATDIDGEKGPSFPLSITCVPSGLQVLGLK